MSRVAVVFGVALLAGFPGPAQSPSYELSADQLEIYTLALRDVVRTVVRPSTNWQADLALDPYLWPSPAPPVPTPPAAGAPRLTAESLQSLLRASGLLKVCEPWSDNACRGNVRGAVVHLSEIAFPGPDSALVVLAVSRARSEFDNTMLIPDTRYFAYTLSRKAGKWKVTSARRRLPAWSPS